MRLSLSLWPPSLVVAVCAHRPTIVRALLARLLMRLLGSELRDSLSQCLRIFTHFRYLPRLLCFHRCLLCLCCSCCFLLCSNTLAPQPRLQIALPLLLRRRGRLCRQATNSCLMKYSNLVCENLRRTREEHQSLSYPGYNP